MSMNNVLKITLWGYDVGRLVWDDKERRAFFSFSPSFLSAGYDIAPLTASISKPYLRQGGIYKGNIEQKIYKGLPEFLADSLPDRWGETPASRMHLLSSTRWNMSCAISPSLLKPML